MDEERLDNAIKEFNDTFDELKGHIDKGLEKKCVRPWIFYVIKYLPIPIARFLLLVQGWFVCQAKVLWYGKERYEIMLNKEMAKLIQMETQMKKDEDRKKDAK